MEERKTKRKLTAILSADVKGYSLLMADDEVHTIQTLKAYRRIITDLISEYSGRVVDSPGDNILAEFVSVVDAVICDLKFRSVCVCADFRLKSGDRDMNDSRLISWCGIFKLMISPF